MHPGKSMLARGEKAAVPLFFFPSALNRLPSAQARAGSRVGKGCRCAAASAAFAPGLRPCLRRLQGEEVVPPQLIYL